MQILMLVNQVKEIYSIRLLLISAINSRQNVSKVKLTTSEIGTFPITLGREEFISLLQKSRNKK